MKNNKITLETLNNKTIELKGDLNRITLAGFDVLDNWYKLEEIEANGIIEVEHFGNYVSYNGYEYLIIEGYDNTIKEATEQAKALIEDCGLNESLVFEAELQGLIDENYFIDFWYEVHEQQAYNEGIEYIATEEEMEQLDNGEIDEDTIRDNYFNTLQSSIKGEEMEEYKFQLGKEEFYNIVLENNLIDLDKLANWCVNVDGAGHYLSPYDGEELEHNNIFLYRIN